MLYPYRIIIADSRSIGGLLLQVNINAVYPTATISVVGTGPEVLQTYERTGADLLILNQNLAIIDSLELTRLLRAKGVTIPIILLANISQIEGLAKKAGVTLFLSGSEIIVQLIRELPKLLQPNPQNK